MDFFKDIDITKPVTDESNGHRLRALVQAANSQFAQVLRKFGAKYRVTDKPQAFDELEDEDSTDEASGDLETQAKKRQLCQTYEQATIWVKDILERSRGRELPGNFNPMLISQLFMRAIPTLGWTCLCTCGIRSKFLFFLC